MTMGLKTLGRQRGLAGNICLSPPSKRYSTPEGLEQESREASISRIFGSFLYISEGISEHEIDRTIDVVPAVMTLFYWSLW